MKHWALRVERTLADTSYRMLAVVHDEIQGEALDIDAQMAINVLRKTATEAGEELGFDVPIGVDAKAGNSWAETH